MGYIFFSHKRDDKKIYQCTERLANCNTPFKEGAYLNPNERKVNQKIKSDVCVNRYYTDIKGQNDAVSGYLDSRFGKWYNDRQYDIFNNDTFLKFLEKIPAKSPKWYLFIDKASPNYKSKKVLLYFEKKDTLIPVYIPTTSPGFMVMEEIWNIAKRHLLVIKYYISFTGFKIKISKYFRTKRLDLDMINYLLRDGF
jgi:hypothetical protein